MASKPPSFFTARRLQAAKQREYSIVDSFKLGYRNREDVTNLPPGVLIVGSQNVLTNVSERVQIRQGYSVDGSISATAAPILSSFDWLTKLNGEVHMRVGDLTSAGNDGKVQYRYDASGTISWRDLMTGQTTAYFNFAKFWNTTESLREVLFVNGTGNIYRWNGATAVLSATTSNTITKTGTTHWVDAGFYTTGTRKVTINGTDYTYTGGETTTTLTGVTPDPTGEANGSIIHQTPVTTAVSSMTGIPSTFLPDLIATLNNQVYVSSTTSSALYISKINSYTDYSSNTPRQTGDGAVLILDDNLVGMIPQENFMYVTAGQDLWYNINFELQTSTVGVTYQQVNALPLKTGRRQAAISQAFLSHMKNNVIVVTQETTIDTFGRVQQSLETPQTTNISDPIKLDVDSYDFTDGSIAYWRFFILVAVPKEGLIRIFNLNTGNWEAPQTIPVSRFYIVDGELYGHSYNSSESYKLFDGYADRVYSGFTGFPIQANWNFAYQNYGSRFSLKKATKMYIEGYINSNTMLTASVTYELDGCQTIKTFTLDGSNSQFVCIGSSGGASLGKNSLGKVKLGGDSVDSINGLPPKFHWFPTFTNTDFYECSIGFSVLGVDNRAELLAFGLAVSGSAEIPVKNMD